MSYKTYCGCNAEKNKRNVKMKKNGFVSRITCLIVASLFILSGCSGEKNNAKPKTSLDNISVGDVVAFGSYEQDNDTSNGAEAIEWEVLDVKDGKALIISRYGLDTKPYHEDKKSVTWETCTLRAWLNNDFYNASFNDAEKAKICLTSLVNNDNQYYEIDGGNDTEDNVFLLSVEEAMEYYAKDKADDVSTDWYILTSGDSKVKATAYAKAKDAFVNSTGKGSYWWLRSIGSRKNSAVVISTGGHVNTDGFYVNNAVSVVRPAMWVSLEG